MIKAIHNFNKKGFTLIELLIVVAIIAILAAIAIPQFSAYRRRGYNSAATSDLRNMRTTQEAMFADFQDYGAGNNGATSGSPFVLDGLHTSTVDQNFSPSNGVYARSTVLASGGKNVTFIAKTSHNAGDNAYGADSDDTATYRKACVKAGACNNTDDVEQAPDTPTVTVDFTGTWAKM